MASQDDNYPNIKDMAEVQGQNQLPVSPAVAAGVIGGAVPVTKAPEDQAVPEAVDPKPVTPVGAEDSQNDEAHEQAVKNDVTKLTGDFKDEVKSEVQEDVPEIRKEAEQLKQKVTEVLEHVNAGSLGQTASNEVALVKLKAQELNVYADQLLAKIKS